MPDPLPREQVDAAVQEVISLRHPDPHQVLGLHRDGEGLVIRAFRPDAVKVTLLPDFGGRVPLEHRRGGVFEARVNGRTDVFGYLLEVTYPGDRTFTVRDPYSFWPTLGDQDLHFAGEGKHERLWEQLGAHPRHHHGVSGVSFTVWAPEAQSVSVVGDFNTWDGRLGLMRKMSQGGIWELFVPEVGEGARYKFEIRSRLGAGVPFLKADPMAFRAEVPPATASVVHDLTRYRWEDAAWMEARAKAEPAAVRMSIYEVHAGSWRRMVEDGGRPLAYRELGPMLADYVEQMGFTHVELLPLAEHPFGGSWGYQVSGYYAPTARYGHPDDLRAMIDHLHQRGIGVIVDWVPAHFPRDAHALGRFDGSAVYEHLDPRQGAHPDWGTYVFNYGRPEVKNFLIANALFWIDQYHVDGLRVDAVASMLYRDYSRKPGEWVPNKWGGRENEEAIAFLRELNEAVTRAHPGAAMIAEESTAWPKVAWPVKDGGLGFHLKWNMGWMHDALAYFQMDPFFRQSHHHKLTFGMWYAYSEKYVLPLSHDEVVHMKGSLIGKMPGDRWRKFANLRSLLAWQWSHPGRPLLFMGGEIAQEAEWNHDRSLDWHLLEKPEHRGVQALVRALNSLQKEEDALWEADDDPVGFQWIQPDAAQANVYAFIRRPKAAPGGHLVVVANLSPVVKHDYAVGVPHLGAYREVLNTDAADFGGSGVLNGPLTSSAAKRDGQENTLRLTLPPLGIVFLAPDPTAAGEEAIGSPS
ncbi:MAG TPA: 1,4-alpha-glucan branching protein GlgB [Myxococcales bacterium]|nr:1,4-alpha-glucan branching protein GlgB [Myxococcales bacterium]